MSDLLEPGQWGLFCGVEGKSLVYANGAPMGPKSARKAVATTPRRLLVDSGVIERAFATGEAPRSTTVELDGHHWILRFIPVISPRTNTLVGLLASVQAEEDATPIPAAPLVGSWEWEIVRDANGDLTPQRRTFWNHELFVVYDVDPGVAQSKAGYWEVGVWQNELVAQADQLRIFASVRDGIRSNLQGPRVLTFRVNTGFGKTNRGSKNLRLVGQIPKEQPDCLLILQGFSYEVPDDFENMAWDPDAARVDDVLRGMLELSDDSMAVVDPRSLEVLMTSPAWRRNPFGTAGYMHDVMDTPDQVAALRAFLLAAVSGQEQGELSVTLNERNAHVTVRAVTTQAGEASEEPDALIRVRFS